MKEPYDELKLVKNALADSIMEYHIEPLTKLPKVTSDFRVKQCCIVYSILEITKNLKSVENIDF